MLKNITAANKIKTLEDKVERVLDEVRPQLKAHGGDARLVAVDDEKVKLEISGACRGCPMAAITFGTIVDQTIKERVPEIKEVIYE